MKYLCIIVRRDGDLTISEYKLFIYGNDHGLDTVDNYIEAKYGPEWEVYYTSRHSASIIRILLELRATYQAVAA